MVDRSHPQPQRVASGHRDGATGSRSAGGYLYANVALGRDISEAQVWEALEAVQLAAVARSMSDGLYTQLGEQGNNLRRAEAAAGAGSRAGGHPAGTDFG